MIRRHTLQALKVQPIHPVCSIHHTSLHHAVKIEIRLYLLVADVQQLLLHLCRVVETVVRLQPEVLALSLLRILLNGARLRIRLRRILRYQLLQEVVHILGILRHRLLERKISIRVIPHQLSLLSPQLRYLHHQRESVVPLTSAVGTMNARLIHPSAQLPVLQARQYRLLSGVYYHDAIFRLAATALSILLALRYVSLAQTSQLSLALHPYHRIVGSLRQQVAPVLLQFRNP
ncbi:unknown [Prevotella sp. CAG:1092]|nr:unknown [Prevotella sp. CAG:1092]